MRIWALLLLPLVLGPASAALDAWSVVLPGAFRLVAGSAEGSDVLAMGAEAWASPDGGSSWTAVAPGVSNVDALAAGAGVLYVGGRDAAGDAVVASSLDGGATWRIVPVRGEHGPVLSIAPQDDVPAHAFVVARSAGLLQTVYETRDAGATWDAFLHVPFAIHALAWDHAEHMLLLGTQVGVVTASPDGTTLPRSASVDVRAVAHGAGFTFASGSGLGVWRSDPPAPLVMIPWANPGGAVLDVAPDAGTGGVMPLTDDGVLHLCIGDGISSFCKLKSPPGDAVRDAWVAPTGARILAASDLGLWSFDR